MKFLLAFLLMIAAPCLHAQYSHADWIKILPDANASLEAKADKLSYGFYFQDRNIGLKVCLVLETSIKSEVPKPENSDQLRFLNPRIKIYARSLKGVTANFELPCTEEEFYDMLRPIAKHEVFELNSKQSPFEPLPMVLDGYTIVCVRNIGLQKKTIERKVSLSIPVRLLVEVLWKGVIKKMETLPKSGLQRFVSLLPGGEGQVIEDEQLLHKELESWLNDPQNPI